MSTKRSRTRRSISAIVVLTVLVLAVGETAQGQAPTIQPRQIAALDLGPETPVWEAHVGVGASKVVAVFNTGFFGGRLARIGYAVYDLEAGAWVAQGQVEPNDLRAIDPSIAHDPAEGIIEGSEQKGDPEPVTNRFLAAALTDDGIRISRFSPARNSFEPWRKVLSLHPIGQHGADRPWIVRGEQNEFYITYWNSISSNYGYIRSRDGGLNWWPTDPEISVIEVNGQAVEGGFSAFPATRPGRPLYVIYPRTNGELGLLVGTDDNQTGGVTFDYLRKADGVTPLTIVPRRTNFSDCFPKYSAGGGILFYQSSAQVALHPGDPNTLFVTYQDTELSDPEDRDVNVYFHVLTRSGAGWTGESVDARKRVNDDEPLPEDDKDQFLPALSVRGDGTVEVTFYDDRKYDQADNSNYPKVDVFYAYRRPGADRFEVNRELCRNPGDCAENDPAYWFTPDLFRGHSFGEYMGLNTRGERTFAVFNGTYLSIERKWFAIWATEIDW